MLARMRYVLRCCWPADGAAPNFGGLLFSVLRSRDASPAGPGAARRCQKLAIEPPLERLTQLQGSRALRKLCTTWGQNILQC